MKLSWQPYWQGLSTREKRLLILVLALLPVFIFWYGLWQPLQRGIDAQQQRIVNYQESLQLLQQLQQASATTGTAVESLDSSVESLLSQSAKSANLTLQRIEPLGDNVAVQLDSARFDRLLSWLVQLDQRYRIRVQSIDIQGDGKAEGEVIVRKLIVRREQ